MTSVLGAVLERGRTWGEARSTAVASPHASDGASVVAAAVAAKIILLFVLAWNSRFVMDELWQSGNAKYVFNGFFTTIWPVKAVGYAVFYLPAHWIGWNAKSMLMVARFETVLLACATLATVYVSARALGEVKLRALLITLILLSFSNFIERIFRTRSEPLAVLFAAAALLVVLRGGPDNRRTVVAAGVLSGLAFLTTQKSIYFNLALGTGFVVDAALLRRSVAGVKQIAWLILGWLMPIVAYCLVFGGNHPLRVAQNLAVAPIELATHGSAAYTDLRVYVVQTLSRNAILYAFCIIGMVLELLRVTKIDGRRRIALIFSITITVLVFTHNQPWPYVFIMALPFASLWSIVPIDRLAAQRWHSRVGWIALSAAVAASFVANVRYFRLDNRAQLELVTRAESLIGPGEHYFDGTGMLPDRRESTRLWLDRSRVLAILREGEGSQAYQALKLSPPKIILWSYRMDAIEPVIAPLVRNSYVPVAPNIRMAGRRLVAGDRTIFEVPFAGTYGLYSATGEPVRGQIEVNGRLFRPPISLEAGPKIMTLRDGPNEALLVPEGSYAGLFQKGPDNQSLFAGVYE